MILGDKRLVTLMTSHKSRSGEKWEAEQEHQARSKIHDKRRNEKINQSKRYDINYILPRVEDRFSGRKNLPAAE